MKSATLQGGRYILSHPRGRYKLFTCGHSSSRVETKPFSPRTAQSWEPLQTPWTPSPPRRHPPLSWWGGHHQAHLWLSPPVSQWSKIRDTSEWDFSCYLNDFWTLFLSKNLNILLFKTCTCVPSFKWKNNTVISFSLKNFAPIKLRFCAEQTNVEHH